MLEMSESLNIANSICNLLLDNKLNSSVVYQQLSNKYLTKIKKNTYMEDIIEHFIQ
jgi:hypothetical protein